MATFTLPGLAIPETWPTPGNPATRIRIFRANVERAMNATPVLTGHVQEAVEVGTKTFLEHRPDMDLQIALDAAIADPELSSYAQAVAFGMEAIFYTLYLRKKAAMEAPAPFPEA